ncbi:MAG: nuclear transport factor 2 family protein [Bacteroidia bacterium]|nr:nuclear transport factor 2 family protein [Bacteroidia bacterium]
MNHIKAIITMKKMIKLYSPTAIVLLYFSLLTGCTNTDKAIPGSSENNSETAREELDSAFKKMWRNVTLTNFADYAKTDVSDDFFTIDADGIVQNKEQLLADTMRLRMLENLKFKFFDQQIKPYGNVGIINGRIQAFADDKYVAEVLYTAVFVKKNGTWQYKNWQGTFSKNSPPPPPFMPEKSK